MQEWARGLCCLCLVILLGYYVFTYDHTPKKKPTIPVQLWDIVLEMRRGGAKDIIIQENEILVFNKDGHLREILMKPIPLDKI